MPLAMGSSLPLSALTQKMSFPRASQVALEVLSEGQTYAMLGPSVLVFVFDRAMDVWFLDHHNNFILL